MATGLSKEQKIKGGYMKSIKLSKIVFAFSLFCLIISAFLFKSVKTFADELKPLDTSVNTVVRIDIPNADGTYTSITGDDAKKWYNEKIVNQNCDDSLEVLSQDDQPSDKINYLMSGGAFHYKYRYLEENHINDYYRNDLKRPVTNVLHNGSSVEQMYTLNVSVSESWSISPVLSYEMKNAVLDKLGSSWGKNYSRNESFSIKVPSKKTLWVDFIPIMERSSGKVEKYFVPRRGIGAGQVFVVDSQSVVTYSPKYLETQMGPFKFKSVYGMYIWHEQ